VRQAVLEAVELTGLENLAAFKVSDLSTGQRRLVELARVLAGPFSLLLLDEPSSGLDQAETEQFGRILTRVVAERNTGILLVEHDMSLVRQVCDRVVVLDFGQQIFEGTPAEMASSEIVRAAYLGADAATELVLSEDPSAEPA
jgi:ABC-type branched-subunit amino acid transport system ATPase component